MPKQKSIYTVHLGCSKNQVDAENILSELIAHDFKLAVNPNEADFVLINTCGFIEPAKEESIDVILNQLEQRSENQKVIVAGCLSERYPKELAQELQGVDYWLGTYKPGEILKKLGLSSPHACDKLPERINLSEHPHHAYIKIAEGCNRKCAFCAIPGIRGKQVSRSINEIVLEAQELEKQGVQEITLIAQDTTFFGREKTSVNENLYSLLKALLKHTTIPWIRTLYWYPEFVDDELLDLMASETRLCKYIDMPIQHASDSILKSMSRRYSQKSLTTLMQKIKDKMPNVALRSTVLVGFPGETHEDFETLMSFIENFQLDHLGGFIYSPEEGTPAEKSQETPVSESDARLRLSAITEYQEEVSLNRNESMIGQKVKIIIDEVAEESEYHFYGRTEASAIDIDDIVKVIEGDAEVGSFYEALVVDAGPHELICKIL